MADYRYINNKGVIVPDTAALRKEVEDEFRTVFGQSINLSPETPQGVLATMKLKIAMPLCVIMPNLLIKLIPILLGVFFLMQYGR